MKCSKEEFDKLFPKGIKNSKERLRRFLANYLIRRKCYSTEQTYQFVYQQIP